MAGEDGEAGPFLMTGQSEAKSLRQWVVDGANFNWRDALEIGTQTALGLKALHQAGLCHGDLWPGNIFMTQDQDLRIEGAGGLSGVFVPLTNILPAAMAVYLAPERLTGGPGSKAADLYGLGTTLFFLVTGREPFPFGNAAEVCQAAMTRALPSLASLGVEAPEGLETLLQRMVAKRPARRYGEVDALLEDIEALRRGKPLSAWPVAQEEPEAKREWDVTATGAVPKSSKTTIIFNPFPPPDPSATPPSSPPSPVPPLPEGVSRESLAGEEAADRPRAQPTPEAGQPKLPALSVARPVSARKALPPLPLGVRGNLNTQVGSTIPQSGLEEDGDKAFLRGQLAEALKTWRKAWEKGPQHPGLKTKIELAAKDVALQSFEKAMRDAELCLETGDLQGATEKAKFAAEVADTQERKEAAAACLDAAGRMMDAAKRRRLVRRLALAGLALLALLLALWLASRFSGK
jgi:hypothetical protein